MYNLSNELINLLKTIDKKNIKYFIRPYIEKENGLFQKGVTSNKFNILKEMESSDFDFITEGISSLSLREFEILIELKTEKVILRETVGHIHGYLINQEELFEDMDLMEYTFIQYDSISNLLSEFWFTIKEVYRDKSNEDCFRYNTDFNSYMYLATNIDVIPELFCAELEDLIMSIMIPNYFEINNFSIYNVVRTIGVTDTFDKFTSLSKSIDEFRYKQYINTMKTKLGYKILKSKDCQMQFFSKLIEYGFSY